MDLVQESAPERLDLKRALLAAAAARRPSVGRHRLVHLRAAAERLQAGIAHPERLVVGHPFNPVYLLPLVEVVGGEHVAGGAASVRPRSTARWGCVP